MITKDLGMVTAYAYAVSKGYTGTETEFAELMASYATVAQEAVDAALAAAQSAQAAESAKDTAQTTVDGAIAGIQAEGQTQIGAVQSEGTTQVGNVNAAGTTQVGAVQAKGTEVINSIPSDYTALSGEVTELKSALQLYYTPTDNYITGWVQGWIRDDGTFGSATKRCRTNIFTVDTDLVTFTVKSGFALSLFEYNTTYDGDLSKKYFRDRVNVFTFAPNKNKYYALQIAKTDNTTLSVADVPADVLLQTDYEITDRSLSKTGKPADAKAVGDKIDALSGAVGNEIIDFSNPDYRQYINTSGTTASWDTPSVSSGTPYKWAVVSCVAGDVFTINGHGGQSPRLWAFCDSSKTIISRADENASANGLEIVAPTGAVYLVINDNTDSQSYVGRLATVRIAENENALDYIFDTTASLHNIVLQNGYVDLQGRVQVQDNRAYTVGYIPNVTKQIIAKDGFVFRVHAYDASDTYIGTYTNNGIFGQSGSSANLTYFDLNQYNYSHYRVSLLKSDDTAVDVSTIGSNYYLNDTVIVEQQPQIVNNINPDNLCLCGIRTAIVDNKIPYHNGFLMHKYDNSANELYFGTTLDNVVSIGQVPSIYSKNFAISPKDGSIIINGGGKLRVFKDGITTSVMDTPRSWLYNSGVDFINDGQGNEYCIYAEYGANEGGGMYVRRGVHPYTSESDWSIVLTQIGGQDINHFHQVRRDPWTNILYLTSGDSDNLTHWWYSTDYGATWALLVSGADVSNTWGASACRCINFVFTDEWIYWATDHYDNHMLCRIKRDATTGVIDLTTFEKLATLKSGCATNSICYSATPHGLFAYERIDHYATEYYGTPVTMQFYDLDKNELRDVVTLGLVSGSTWGGSRGKCYINYANPNQPYPAMGFASDTPCIFDLVYDDVSKIGTVVYNIDDHTVKTVLL